jgi:hypothetical protein
LSSVFERLAGLFLVWEAPAYNAAVPAHESPLSGLPEEQALKKRRRHKKRHHFTNTRLMGASETTPHESDKPASI